MDDSFRVRVAKVFGSLSSAASSSLGSLWSLTDDEVEKREWNRDKDGTTGRDDETTPCSSSFDGFSKKDRRNKRNHCEELEDELDDLNGDEEVGGGSSNRSLERDDDERDAWEIRSSIGLDRTLDNEDEEDEYDKVALGREDACDRLYMRDVTDSGSGLSFHKVLPNSLHVATRDPRANHLAARIRLEEDEAAAQNSDSQQACDKTLPDVMELYVKACEDGGKLKSILKRKEKAANSSFQKRVRFDPGCRSDCGESSEKAQDFLTRTPSMEREVSDDGSLFAQDSLRVPDYILNPSRYTRYSLTSNSQVHSDFLEPMESDVEEASVDLPETVTYIPKKARDTRVVDVVSETKQSQEDSCKHSLHYTGFPVGNACEEAQEIEVGATEEDDEPVTNAADERANSKKPGRQYQTKARSDDGS